MSTEYIIRFGFTQGYHKTLQYKKRTTIVFTCKLFAYDISWNLYL